MMEIITFFVVYYHVFFISSAVVIGIDYIMDTEIFSALRDEMDKPFCSFLIFTEFAMAITALYGYLTSSVLLMSALWVISIILVCTVLFTIVVYAVHKLLDMQW